MIVVTELAGLLGPYTDIEVKEDRLTCDGADLPFTVIGEYTQLDIEVPAAHRAEDFDLVDGVLVLKTAPPGVE